MEKAIDRQRVLLAHLLPSASASASSAQPQLAVSLPSRSAAWLVSLFLTDWIRLWLINYSLLRSRLRHGPGVGVRGRGQRRLPEDLLLRGRCRRRRVSLPLPCTETPLLCILLISFFSTVYNNI
jgi:hypothetical protein